MARIEFKLEPNAEKPKWVIWLIWAVVGHYTVKKDSFFTYFWVILSVYWSTMAQMSQMTHLTHYGSNESNNSFGFFCEQPFMV